MVDSSPLISDTSSSNLSSIDGDISGSDKVSNTSLKDIEGEDMFMVSRDCRKWKGTGGFSVPSISIDYIPTPSEKVIKTSSILGIFELMVDLESGPVTSLHGLSTLAGEKKIFYCVYNYLGFRLIYIVRLTCSDVYNSCKFHFQASQNVTMTS